MPGNQNPLERHAHLFLRAWRAQLRGLWRGMLRQSTHDKAKSGKARAAGKLLRETISYLFQNFALVEDRTVAFNLLLALHYTPGSAAHKRARVQEALEAVGLAGYEEQKIFRLSGGEQQRVAIARNMIKPGSIILADEPTGSVDAKNRDVILELLHMLNGQGKTIVIVTHDPCVAGACGREVRLLPA